MKTIQLFLLVFCLGFLALEAQAQGKEKVKKEAKDKAKGGKAKGNQIVDIQTSAQCEMCKERLEKALMAEAGIKSAILDLETKKMKVVYNSNKISDTQIRQVIANTGYDADNVGANTKVYDSLPNCCKKGGH
jgi:copper chaperone CopZ